MTSFLHFKLDRDYMHDDTFTRLSLSHEIRDETKVGATKREFIFYRQDETRLYETLVSLVSWASLSEIM